MRIRTGRGVIAALIFAGLWIAITIWAWVTTAPLAFRMGAPVLAVGFGIAALIQYRRARTSG